MINPKIIIHGGIGQSENIYTKNSEFNKALIDVATKAFKILLAHGSRASVISAITMLEDNPIFNAGTGSKLQKDAQARMSASLISSDSGIFSGVINIRNVKNPIIVADLLSKNKHTVLSGDQATEFARKKGIHFYDPVTKQRVMEYQQKTKGDTGTVGAVAIDKKGVITSATSTGGIGYEIAGRVSDSATVAGNYASKHAGVSCTGKGEKITNFSVASRLATLIEAGQSLDIAATSLIYKFKKSKSKIGFIALDKFGSICVGNGYNANVLFASNDGKSTMTFLSKKSNGIYRLG